MYTKTPVPESDDATGQEFRNLVQSYQYEITYNKKTTHTGSILFKTYK
jgi:hypothetical protein